MVAINITISGKTYRMACDEGEEERLEKLAHRLDQTVDDLRNAFGEVGDLRLAVMAGIVMTDSLDEKERQIEALQNDLEVLRDRRLGLHLKTIGAEDDVIQRISSMAERADALAQNLL